MLDMTLVYSAIVLFGLSWLAAYLISFLPVPCQLKWLTWFVAWIGAIFLTEAQVRWDATIKPQYVIIDLFILFTVSIPSLIWLNQSQIKLLGYEHVNSEFYRRRLIGLVATWRNFIQYSGLFELLRAVLFSLAWPVWDVLANAYRASWLGKIQRHKGRTTSIRGKSKASRV